MLPSSGILAGAAHLFFSPTSRWQQTFPPRGSQKLKLTGLTVLPSVLWDHIRRRRWERSLTWGANGALHFCTASLSVYKKESGQACRMGFPAGTQSHNDIILFYSILQIKVPMMAVMSSVDTEQTDKQKISYFQFSLLFFYFQTESHCVALVLIEFDV